MKLRRTTLFIPGTLPEAQVHHSRYADFLTDPFAVVRSVYEAFGRELAPDVEARMKAYLANRPKDAHGKHEYSFDDLGLDRASESAGFARYRSTFSVPEEG